MKISKRKYLSKVMADVYQDFLSDVKDYGFIFYSPEAK